jgi:ATP-dependent helicase/nuclease subunit B
MDAIAESHHARRALASLMSRLRGLMEGRRAHPARTVVLLPFAHLLQPAREAWAREAPQGFLPRFETTSTWAANSAPAPSPESFSGDVARDLLTARALIERAGLADRADLLAPRLVEAARQLAPVAAAVEPRDRGSWAQSARHAVNVPAPVLAHESAVAAIAIEWLAASTFPSDGLLLDADRLALLELLVVVEGLRQEPLAQAIAARVPGRVEVLSFLAPAPAGRVALHAAADPSDEAERAAACVLRHVREGRTPVALAAIDRVLTRRIRALLEQAGAAIRDETGWTLSTTRAAAHVMLALKACAWNAGADAVIDWLKNSPAHAPGSVLALERRVRRAGIRDWRALRAADLGDGQQALLDNVNGWREAMHSIRPLPQWLAGLRTLLQASGQWPRLEQDAAGMQAVAALRLREFDGVDFDGFAPASRRMTLPDFVAWVQEVLEAGHFAPPAASAAQVAILPFHSLVGRPFEAVVLPGCDEARLPASPDPAGMWTPAQRAALGLPTREELQQETLHAWRHALQAPEVDVTWRSSDEKGEPILPSVLVQQLQLQGAGSAGEDAREQRTVAVQPVVRPQPIAPQISIGRLSASAYEDLRRCPYRFFALRQLALQEPDEIDVDLDKRDFGNWLHKVLSAFHRELAARPRATHAERAQLLDQAALAVQREMRLDEGEFLPFRAGWPQARDGYLAWLAKHESAEGAVFDESEGEHERDVEGLALFGRIDRIDRLPGGRRMVMDYKTEGIAGTERRVKQPGEDTQLAFYAALLGDESLRAAYVNVGERGETRTVEQQEVAAARDLLLGGIVRDMARIVAGAPLPALGEGQACEYCAARGLCRKDFWA